MLITRIMVALLKFIDHTLWHLLHIRWHL